MHPWKLPHLIYLDCLVPLQMCMHHVMKDRFNDLEDNADFWRVFNNTIDDKPWANITIGHKNGYRSIVGVVFGKLCE